MVSQTITIYIIPPFHESFVKRDVTSAYLLTRWHSEITHYISSRIPMTRPSVDHSQIPWPHVSPGSRLLTNHPVWHVRSPLFQPALCLPATWWASAYEDPGYSILQICHGVNRYRTPDQLYGKWCESWLSVYPSSSLHTCRWCVGPQGSLSESHSIRYLSEGRRFVWMEVGNRRSPLCWGYDLARDYRFPRSRSHLPMVASVTPHIARPAGSENAFPVTSMARTMAAATTNIQRQKTAPRPYFWRRLIRTCDSMRRGRAMTVHSWSQYQCHGMPRLNVKKCTGL